MRLSVVVTIVDAREALVRCLDALAAQRHAPEMDVIVPWDDSVPDMADIIARFRDVRFVSMGHVGTARPKMSAAGQHELFDRRRAAGLAEAKGDVVAILEDRGVPRADWASTMLAVHERLPRHQVIGGAIENGRDAWLNWAIYFCDFGRYQLPFESGPRDYVSDVNIGYKRAALERTRHLWQTRYHETTVHWALQRSGETLYLIRDLIVDQHRDRLRLGALLGERFSWGRLFAYTRAREIGFPRRVAFGVLAPLLSVLLITRHARMQAAKRVAFARFLGVSPVVFVLLVSWSLGEAVGYLSARP